MKPSNIRTAVIAGACALIGAAGGIAGVSAATSDDGSSGATGASGSSGAQQSQQGTQAQQQPGTPPPDGRGGPGGRGGPHVGANGKQEEALTGETADKVKAAALDRVDGTVERVETDVDHGSPYEAHVRKSDGTEVEVLVNKDFEVTATNAMRHP